MGNMLGCFTVNLVTEILDEGIHILVWIPAELKDQPVGKEVHLPDIALVEREISAHIPDFDILILIYVGTDSR